MIDLNTEKTTWEEAVLWLKRQPDQQELVKACYYDDPLEEAAERFRLSDEWQGTLEILKPYLPGKVLELGAGRGIATYALARSGCHVVALEPDPGDVVGGGAIASLRDAYNLPIEIVQSYGESLPLPDHSIDIAYGRAVLHHALDLNKLFREVARVLKPGGIFLAVRETLISKPEDLQAFLDSHPLHHLFGGEHAFLMSEYEAAIREGGFKVLKTWGHFDTVVNYAPTTPFDHKMYLKYQHLVPRWGEKTADFLLRIPGFVQWYSERVSKRFDHPGRHIAFLLQRPR